MIGHAECFRCHKVGHKKDMMRMKLSDLCEIINKAVHEMPPDAHMSWTVKEYRELHWIHHECLPAERCNCVNGWRPILEKKK